MSWEVETVRIADAEYFETLNGLWKGKKEPFAEAGVIRNTNFTPSGLIDYSNVAYLDVEEKQLSKRRLKQGDIILERSGGGPKQPVGRVVFFELVDGAFSFSNFTSVVRVKEKNLFDPKFVFYGLMELYQSGRTEDIQRRTTGIRNLDFSAYKERARFPKIPLAEQKKIARVLSMVQQAIEAQQRIIQTTTELKKALMRKLLTEGLRNEPQKQTEIGPAPESWAESTLDELTVIQTGGTPSRNNREFWVGGTIPWVKTGEIDYRTIISTDEFITHAGLNSSNAKLFPKGTLLVAMYGQGITRGRVGLLGIDASTNQACAAITPRNHRQIGTEYLYFYLQFHYEELRARGHGANQKNLSVTLLKAFPVVFPESTDQETIVTVLKNVDTKIRLAEARKGSFQDLFRTLLHELMTAKIRVHDLELPSEDRAA